MLQEIRHTKNISRQLTKNARKSYEKTYDTLLADVGIHQTRMQKFVRKTYEIVTC